MTKRFSHKKLSDDNPIAFKGEAGYQADLLMPGLRWKWWPLYQVKKFPWVQVPAGEIGVVVAQVGKALPIGAKSARYKTEFGNFSDLKTFVAKDGEKGVQRPVLTPGTLVPMHPVGFLVLTKKHTFGLPLSAEMAAQAKQLKPEEFNLVTIAPEVRDGKPVDMVGIVQTLEGDPLPSGDIANRLGEFKDVAEMEGSGKTDSEIIETLLGNKNNLHNNFQDFQRFLDNGGRIGLQHDPLMYGAYTINPFLVRVERVPMLVVNQGEVAVVKAYVGLVTQDTSGAEFKFGSIVRPGHRGIWQEPLRTGKYAINPRCYAAEIVPTAILTLNWADAVSKAHNLDQQLRQIDAKSREGFEFMIDLQVQIHVPDTKAPRVISMVGTMQNLVNEVLQAAVGNHFRDKLQGMPAIKFIETRNEVQTEAFEHIKDKLDDYQVETRGVYIQDVVLPKELVQVLTQREIASQEIETYKKQKEAEDQRVIMAQAKGTADMQKELAQSQVGVEINKNKAEARKAEADGEATYVERTGRAKGAEIEAVGMARAKSYEAQVAALGQTATALVNVTTALADKGIKIMPEVLVTGGNGGGPLEALAATLTQTLYKNGKGHAKEVAESKL